MKKKTVFRNFFEFPFGRGHFGDLTALTRSPLSFVIGTLFEQGTQFGTFAAVSFEIIENRLQYYKPRLLI